MELTRDEMILCEKVDMEALKTIQDNFDYLYDNQLLGRFVDPHQKRKYITDKQTIFTILSDFYKQKSKTDMVKYKFSKGLTWGRMFSIGVSLQGISRVIRHTIAKNYYVDLDIVNAHPKILMKYCQDAKVDAPFLNKYIEKREECLKELMTFGLSRDDAKAFPLAVINGGDRSSKFEKGHCPDWLMGLESDIKNIYKVFVKTAKGKRFNKRAQDLENKKEYSNIEGSTLNYLLCEQENIILTRIYRYLLDVGAKVGTFCFDGCMIYSDTWKDDYIVRIKEIVLEELGYDLEFKVKPLDEGVDLGKLNLKPIQDIPTTEQDLALYVLSKVDENVLYGKTRDEVYIYDDKSALWEKFKNFSTLKTRFSDILDVYLDGVKNQEDREKLKASIRTSGKQTSIMTILSDHLQKKDDDELIDKLDTKPNILPINDNLVVDLTTNKTRPRLKDDYFSKSIEVTHNEEPDVEQVFAYIRSVLEVDGVCRQEYIDYFLKVIGYTFTGLSNLKLFFILHGEKDAGKSLLIKLLSAVLGKFSGSTNERVFKESRSEAVHDTAVFSLIGKRINHVGELKKGDKFNEELLKRVTGGDSLNIRKSGSDDNVETTPNSVLFLATNGIPKFEDQAFSKRMRVFTFPNKFATNNRKFVDKLFSSVDNFFSVFCMYAKMFNDEGLDDVDEVMASTDKVIASTIIDPFAFFKKSLDACDIEITGIETDTIKKTELYGSFLEFLHSEGIKDTLGRNHFYMEILKWEGVKDGRENNLRVFTGIKKVEEKYNASTSSYPPI